MSLAITSDGFADLYHSHGTGPKDWKLTQQFDFLSLAMPIPYEELSVKPEEEEEEEEDDDEEEESDEWDALDEDEEEEFGLCDVCLKEEKHSKFDCPYLDRIQNPNKVTVGSGYDIVCRRCHALGGHPERDWVGRAIMSLVLFVGYQLLTGIQNARKTLTPEEIMTI